MRVDAFSFLSPAGLLRAAEGCSPGRTVTVQSRLGMNHGRRPCLEGRRFEDVASRDRHLGDRRDVVTRDMETRGVH